MTHNLFGVILLQTVMCDI